MSTNFVLGGGKTLEMPPPTVAFDENNPKYKHLCRKVHIRNLAKFVSVSLILGVLINISYSLACSPTVIVYSLLLAAFSIGVYGSLIYATFKEKQKFTIPFLVFQAIFIALLVLLFFGFLLCSMFSPKTLTALAIDLGGVNPNSSPYALNSAVRAFVVLVMLFWVFLICIQSWYFEIIYRFHQYLEERESSFVFNLEPEFRARWYL